MLILHVSINAETSISVQAKRGPSETFQIQQDTRLHEGRNDKSMKSAIDSLQCESSTRLSQRFNNTNGIRYTVIKHIL